MDDISTLDSLSNKAKLTPEQILEKYLSTRDKEKKTVQAFRDNKVQLGLTTGYKCLDKYFRFKLGSFVVVCGHGNVGKSFGVWYLIVLSYCLHGWKWVIFSSENDSGEIRVQLVEFICGDLAHNISQEQYDKALDLVYEVFVIIDFDEDIEDPETARKILEITQQLKDKDDEIKGLLIDPYNSLDKDLDEDQRLSTHDANYKIAKSIKTFNKKNKMSTWVNMHAISNALRKIDDEGYPLPPNPADTEGGGLWFNRSDEFITWHRYVQDSERNRTSEIHVRKIKSTRTGGAQTDLNNPVKLEWKKFGVFWGFYGVDDKCPLAEYLIEPEDPPEEEKKNIFQQQGSNEFIDEEEDSRNWYDKSEKKAPF